MFCWYLLNVSAHISIYHEHSFASVRTGSRLRSSTRRMLIPSFSALHWIHPRGSQHQSSIHPRVSEEEYPTKVIMTNFHSLPALLGYNISFHPSLHPGPGHMGSDLSRETQSSPSPSYILQLIQGNTKTEDWGTPRMAKPPHMAFSNV